MHKTDRKITHFFPLQYAQNASNSISQPPFCKKFSGGGGMPPDPPRGSCPPGTRNTPTAYFKNLADYFQIYGEHCLYTLCCCQNEELG